MIDFNTFTKLPKNVRYLGKLIVAKRFIKLSTVQKIAQSGHTACDIYNERSTIDTTSRISNIHKPTDLVGGLTYDP